MWVAIAMSMYLRNELAPCTRITFKRTILEDIISAAALSRKLAIVPPAMVDESSGILSCYRGAGLNFLDDWMECQTLLNTKATSGFTFMLAWWLKEST